MTIDIAVIFKWDKNINNIDDGKDEITVADLKTLTDDMKVIISDLLGLEIAEAGLNKNLVGGLSETILGMRMEEKNNKEWAKSDMLRDKLTSLGVKVKYRKDGFDWELYTKIIYKYR